eukprot:144025-Pelagomonas_calceolata.AAC.1
MSMKSVSKFNGTLVVKPQLFKLVECMFCITHSTNTQENGMKRYDFRTNEFAESACCRCAAPNCCPGLVSSQYLISINCTCHSLKACGGHCLIDDSLGEGIT